MKKQRVKFYSVNDMAIRWHLNVAENILKIFANEIESAQYSINDIIEFYNISLYIVEHGIFLKKWTDEEINLFVIIAKKFESVIGRFFSTISDENIIPIYLEVDSLYKEDFFKLITRYKVTERISQNAFAHLLGIEGVILYPILKSKEMVSLYGEPLRFRMLSDPSSAEILLDKYEIQHLLPNDEIYIPKNLTIEEKETIILLYIYSEQPNYNYLRLISNIQSSKDKIALSAETQLKAKKRAEEMEVSLFENSTSEGFKIQLQFSDSQTEFTTIDKDDSSISVSYSTAWIYENLDYATILNNYIYMFEYADIHMRCNMVNRLNQMGVFERYLLFESKNAYRKGAAFNFHDVLSLMQMNAYYNLLFGKGIRIESVIEWFFLKYLDEEFGVKNYSISMPSPNTTPLEKCTLIMPAMEHVLKQFSQFVTNKTIDHELLDIQSQHLIYEEIPSLCQQKYIYGIGDEYTQVTFLLFSNQSGLGYYDKKQKSYDNYYELLKVESTYIDDYSEWERPRVQWLIDHEYLSLTESNEIRFNNLLKLQILYELYFKDVVLYWSYSNSGRKIIDDFVVKGIVEYENRLLSRPEADYFNFYLNKSKFNNGLNLRNKYSHTQPFNSKEVDMHKQNFMIFLRLFVIVIIKINDDFCTHDKLDRKINIK